MNLKLFGTGLAALALLASFVLRASGRHSAARLQRAFVRWSPTTTGPASTPASTAATAGAPRTGRTRAGTSIKPKGGLFGGTLGYNYQVGSLVYGLEGDFDWSGVKGSVACVPASFTCETENTLARHLPRPDRLCLRSLAAVHHRRRRLRQRQGDRQRLHRGRRGLESKSQLGWTVGARPRIRLPRQLDRQDRIPLCRSRQFRRRLPRRSRTTSASRKTSFAPA